MFDLLNSIKRHFYFDLIIGTIFVILMAYTFIDKTQIDHFTVEKKISVAIYVLLFVHGIVLFTFSIINIVKRKYVKSIGFFVLSVSLMTMLYFCFSVLFFSLTWGTSLYVDEPIYNLQKSALCHKINTSIVKAQIRDFENGKFPRNVQMDNNLKRVLQTDTNFKLPKQIFKIECGCRAIDTSTVVLKVWAKNDNYEINLSFVNGNWKYENIQPAFFE